MEDKKYPELVLEPEMEIPKLTLTPNEPTEEEVLAAAELEKKPIIPVDMDEKLLTEEERKVVEEFAEKIDVRDSNMILQYGSAAQKNVASFSESALNSVRNKDLGEIGSDLSALVTELKGFGVRKRRALPPSSRRAPTSSKP